MGNLNADQYASVADSLTTLAAAINAYLNSNPSDPSFVVLSQSLRTINNVAAGIEQAAAKADYEDSASAFVKLNLASTQIRATTSQLQQQVSAIGRVLGVVAKAAALATALSSGVASQILSSAEQVIVAAHG